MMESYFLNKPFDLPLSYVQPYYNVYALRTPIIYQDSAYGGAENQTRIQFNDVSDEKLPEGYYSKCDSVITCNK